MHDNVQGVRATSCDLQRLLAEVLVFCGSYGAGNRPHVMGGFCSLEGGVKGNSNNQQASKWFSRTIFSALVVASVVKDTGGRLGGPWLIGPAIGGFFALLLPWQKMGIWLEEKVVV